MLELIVSVYLLFLGFKVFEKPGSVFIPKKETWIVVHADGRYWRVNEEGWIFDVADMGDLLRYTIVEGVEIEELKLSDENLGILKKLHVLNDPYVSVLNVSRRYVITVKGIVLYFQRWEDLNDYFERIKEQIVYSSPKSRYFLYEGGRLVLLRGD